MAAATAVLEGMRTQITLSRQKLQTTQEMRAVADQSRVELIAGMAEPQKQLIDSAQLQLEMEQDGLSILQADRPGTKSIRRSAERSHARCSAPTTAGRQSGSRPVSRTSSNEYSAEFGVPQEFTTTVSVREMLGFKAPRTDDVTLRRSLSQIDTRAKAYLPFKFSRASFSSAD